MEVHAASDPSVFEQGNSVDRASERADAAEAEEVLGDLARVFFEGTEKAVANVGAFPADGSSTKVPLPNLADKYRALVEQIPAVVFMAHLGGGLSEAYVNPQIEKILGFKQSEWLEDPVRWYRQIHPDDKQRWSVEAAEMFLTGKPLRSAYRVLARDGKVVWFQCEARMVRWDDGRPWFIHGVGFDISELKRAETALQSERNFASGVLDTVGALVIVLDLQGRIIRFNRACENIIGYTLQEAQERPIWDLLMSPDEAPAFQQSFAKAQMNGAHAEHENNWINHKGEIRVIAWSSTVLPGTSDMPTLVILGGIDITERKRLEALALAREAAKTEETLELLQRLIDSMSESLLMLDVNGRVQKINQAAAALFSLKKEEFLGTKLLELLNNPEFPVTPAELLQRAPDGRLYLETALQSRRRPAAIPVSVSCVLVHDRSSAIMGLLLVFQDITERKEAESALRRTEKLAATGRLAATIAHEINNPLEAVTNLLYLARRDVATTTKTRRYLEIADRELDRVALLAKQTLGFYRDTTSPVRFRASAAIADVLAIYARRASGRNIAIEDRLDADVEVFGFAGEFRQVLSNLVGNAIDAMRDDGGRLVVRARRTHSWADGTEVLRISIADTGLGIPPKHRERIFDAFFTTKSHVGTGLGLWLSRGIVEKHGGSIRLRSRVTDGCSGTVFSLLWPLESQPARIISSHG
jgi:PAS domain S-box-containing protein